MDNVVQHFEVPQNRNFQAVAILPVVTNLLNTQQDVIYIDQYHNQFPEFKMNLKSMHIMCIMLHLCNMKVEVNFFLF